ncbi:mRNA-binding protein PUF3 [Spathaspora sp. JA1]|nr:mRNA-binding protein PUF3 [Spathaspora sp. JA1]
MPSETIWSSANTSPMQSNSNLNLSNPQYKSVLDQVDPEVAKLFTDSTNPLDSLASTRRFSFNDGSDIESGSNFFGIKRGTFSAITAPVGNHYGSDILGAATATGAAGKAGGAGGAGGINFGTASISGGIASRHPPQDSFLQKFSTVADATREIEFGNLSLGKVSPAASTSLSATNSQDQQPIKSLYNSTSPHGSLNENLNMPIPRSSRQQSISEKIDNYNNNSPIQTSTALSINSDLSGDKNINNTNNNNINHRFWNPATAASFTPTYNYFMDANQMPIPPPPQGPIPPGAAMHRNGQAPQPISPPPPFMIPSPPPPQFVDPGLYGMMEYGGFPPPPHMMPPNMMPPPPPPHPVGGANEDESKESDENKDKSSINMAGGIGLMNRQFSPASFMFHPFSYSPVMTSQSPPTQGPPGNTTQQQPQQPNSKQSTPSREFQSTPPQSAGGKGRKPGKVQQGKAPGGGGNHIYRSPLLEEIRANPKDKEFHLSDIYGHGVEFTKDQYGSRFIQQKLSSSSEEEKTRIFEEIKDISYDLMTDVFGNYVIQKYFEFGLKDHQEFLLSKMKGHIYELSLQMYGCRVVQRALESLPFEGQFSIIDELKDYILICAKDQNGNHVIQKSIEMIKPFDKIRFILLTLNDHIYQLSIHPYGCRVIQRLLEFSNLKDQREILDQLNKYIFYLIQDQYGNYVIQHILEHGNEQERNEILKVVQGSVVTFSKHKFASNVIEKCIKFGNNLQKKKILDEVMIGNEDFQIETVSDDSSLALMMKDQYANYVIQKLVEGFDSKSLEKKKLVVKLRQYLKQISNKNNYGGKHLASVEKMIIVAETALDD